MESKINENMNDVLKDWPFTRIFQKHDKYLYISFLCLGNLLLCRKRANCHNVYP